MADASPDKPELRAPSTSAIGEGESAQRSCRLIIEHMQEGAVTLSHDENAIVYCNPSFAQMLGLAPERLLGHRMPSFLEPRGELGVEALLSDADARHGEFTLISGCQRLPVCITATSVHDDRGCLRCLIVDDNGHPEREGPSRDCEVLVWAEPHKNEFIAMLGHELRNPLAPIRHAVELLGQQSEPSPQDVLHARTVIERQVRHMTRLVDDLIDIGRITRGTLRLQESVIEVEDVVKASLESTTRLVSRRGHQLTIHIEDADLRIQGDAIRLTQAITNILSNAAKYTPERGQISLTVERRRDDVVISVSDNGQGIHPDMLPHVFDPFIRAHESIDRSAGGLGIGLALVKRIVELHRGTVSAYSAGPGHGSRFSLHIPGLVAQPGTFSSGPDGPVGPASDSAGPESDEPTKRRILVVDDNADAAEMLGLILSSRGHEIEIAYDGEQALAMAASFVPEIICLDIGLPGLDGYEVARRLRLRPPSEKRLMLIALTGYGQAEDRELAHDAGFDHHLVKPATTDAIEAALARYDESPGSIS